MLNDETLNPLLNDGVFLQLAYDDSIQKLAQSGKPRKLYHSRPVNDFLSHSGSDHALNQLDPDHLDTFVPTPQK